MCVSQQHRQQRLLDLVRKGVRFDVEDTRRLCRYTWRISRRGFVIAVRHKPSEPREVRMHRVIMGSPPYEVKHIDGNTLDCRKSNLRVCSYARNIHNKEEQLCHV